MLIKTGSIETQAGADDWIDGITLLICLPAYTNEGKNSDLPLLFPLGVFSF